MGITLQLYCMYDHLGETPFLSADTLVSTIDYNGVDLSLPTGEIRLPVSGVTVTHFAFQVEGRTHICKITGIHKA